MSNRRISPPLPPATATNPSSTSETATPSNPRRSFLKGLGIAGATLTAGALLAGQSRAQQSDDKGKSGGNPGSLSAGDTAILRFLAAAEIIETDLWQQYAELGGLTTGAQNNYQLAFQQLDGDAGQYITSNTNDEHSHAAFLNAYLAKKGAPPVNFSQFHTLPSSKANGAKQIGRLTNLTQLTVDTSWYTRYRSRQNPDFGASFPQAIKLVDVPGIPRDNSDFGPKDHVQAIANTAAFHFAFIEQGGSSLYSAMAQKASDAEVLRIVLSIGGDEVAHFLEWVDFAGNGVQTPIAPFTDPTNGLTFPDFNATGERILQTNLIFPVPCEFIDSKLPLCAVIRPTDPTGIAAGAVKAFTDDGLFIGQSSEFFDTLNTLAEAADKAQRNP
jgi:Ferritin-like domain